MAHGHDDRYVAGIPRHYFKIWAILTGLFVVSFIGPFIGRAIGGSAELPLVLTTAFGIAIWKAMLVVKEFMHLPLEKKFIFYIEAVSVAFMFLFFFGVAPDVMKHHGQLWENVAAQKVVEEGMAAGGGEGHDGGHGDDHGDDHGGDDHH